MLPPSCGVSSPDAASLASRFLLSTSVFSADTSSTSSFFTGSGFDGSEDFSVFVGGLPSFVVETSFSSLSTGFGGVIDSDFASVDSSSWVRSSILGFTFLPPDCASFEDTGSAAAAVCPDDFEYHTSLDCGVGGALCEDGA